MRDILIVNFFGATYEADMAVLIVTVQDLLLNFFLGSAFSVALMPDFIRKNTGLGNVVYAYHKKFTFSLLVIIILFILNINIVIHYLAPGLPLEYQHQLTSYLSISIFSIPFIVYASITGAALNSIGVFVLPSLGTAIYNFVVCVFLILPFMVIKIDPFYSIAMGVAFGAILRWAIQFKKLPFEQPILRNKTPMLNLKKFFKLYSGALLASSSIFILPIIARIFASEQGMGQLAIFNFVSKLIDFPISFLSGVVTTILIPKLIEPKNNWKMIYYSVLGLFFAFLIILLGTYLLSDIIVGILLMFGKVSSKNMAEISEQLRNASLMLPAYGVTFFLVAALATTKYSKFYGVFCFILNILFYCFGHLYIKKFSDIYTVLIGIYSILAVVGFTLSLIQVKSSTPKEHVI